MLGRALVHEFHISYSHTKWYLLFLLGEIAFAVAEASPVKN